MIDRLTALIEEHESEGMGPLIYEVVTHAIAPVMRRYPPAVLARRSVDRLTDDIVDVITVEFAEFLLRAGRLTEAFAHASSERHLLYILRQRASQFLQNRSRGGEQRNIHDRAARILAGDSRFAHAARAETSWHIQGQNINQFDLDDEELRRLARALPYPESALRRRRDTAIASSVLSDADLTDLIYRALGLAGAALTLRQLDVVLDERLGLRPFETVSLHRRTDEEGSLEDILAVENTAFGDLEVRQIAGDVVGELSLRQLRVLRYRLHEHKSRDETARLLNVANGTVGNELDRIRDTVLAATDGDVAKAKHVLLLITDAWIGR